VLMVACTTHISLDILSLIHAMRRQQLFRLSFFEAAVAAGWWVFVAMQRVGRWTVHECPWAGNCSASSWKKRNSSYESEAGSG
jgi:hypothetical protein